MIQSDSTNKMIEMSFYFIKNRRSANALVDWNVVDLCIEEDSPRLHHKYHPNVFKIYPYDTMRMRLFQDRYEVTMYEWKAPRQCNNKTGML